MITVVIDGYNLLRAIYPKERGKLDKQRQMLIRRLGHYKSERSDQIKQIVVVFDGGLSGRAQREIRGGIVVVFAGQRESADDWIADYIERNTGDFVLVTRDRELIQRCKKPNVEAVKVGDFYSIMEDRLLERVAADMERDQQDVPAKKFERNGGSEVESEALDILMEDVSVDTYAKDDPLPWEDDKKGRSSKMSKKKKKRHAKLKKL